MHIAHEEDIETSQLTLMNDNYASSTKLGNISTIYNTLQSLHVTHLKYHAFPNTTDELVNRKTIVISSARKLHNYSKNQVIQIE